MFYPAAELRCPINCRAAKPRWKGHPSIRGADELGRDDTAADVAFDNRGAADGHRESKAPIAGDAVLYLRKWEPARDKKTEL